MLNKRLKKMWKVPKSKRAILSRRKAKKMTINVKRKRLKVAHQSPPLKQMIQHLPSSFRLRLIS